VTTCVKCPLGKLTGNSPARDLTGGWSQRHLLVGTRPNSRLSAGRLVFLHKPHCAYDSSGIGKHSAVRAMGTRPKSQFPDTCPGPSLHMGLAQEGGLRPVLTALCTGETDLKPSCQQMEVSVGDSK